MGLALFRSDALVSHLFLARYSNLIRRLASDRVHETLINDWVVSVLLNAEELLRPALVPRRLKNCAANLNVLLPQVSLVKLALRLTNGGLERLRLDRGFSAFFNDVDGWILDFTVGSSFTFII